ncbi:MAG: pirin family protein [Bacteroidales bacterium]
MKSIIYKANSRGHFENDWLNTRYSFSFADYFDRSRIHFGALRVLNDDIIQPTGGFGKHPHDNMEIITVPLSGKLAHQDSMGHKQEIKVNEVQVMSAGSGIFHSEFNASQVEECSLLQIWIYPSAKNIKPRYDQKYFDPELAKDNWQLLVSGHDNLNGALSIHQNAIISRIYLTSGNNKTYTLNEQSFGSFVFVIKGEIEIDNNKLLERDSIGIYDTKSFEIKAKRDAQILNIEVPDIQ